MEINSNSNTNSDTVNYSLTNSILKLVNFLLLFTNFIVWLGGYGWNLIVTGPLAFIAIFLSIFFLIVALSKRRIGENVNTFLVLANLSFLIGLIEWLLTVHERSLTYLFNPDLFFPILNILGGVFSAIGFYKPGKSFKNRIMMYVFSTFAFIWLINLLLFTIKW